MSKTMIDPKAINQNLSGGVIIIDIEKCGEIAYVKTIFEELSVAPALVVLKQSNSVYRIVNTVSIKTDAIVVNHYFTDSQERLVKHNHNFKPDGSYSLSVNTWILNSAQ